MAMQWTPEQKSVIEARGSDLVVSAAAGSGKTAVLVERICSLVLQDGVDIDRMLICTFTRAAAAEMKQRIVARFEQELAARPDDRRLRAQVLRVERAQIGTLHGFCSVLLSRYGHGIALEPGFRTEEDAVTGALFAQAMGDVLHDAFEKGDAAFLELADCWGGRDGSALAELITRTYHGARNHPNWRLWLQSAASQFAFSDPFATPWLPVLLDMLQEQLQLAQDCIGEALALCVAPGGPAVYASRLSQDELAVLALRDALRQGGLDGLRQALPQAVFGRMPAMKETAKTPLSEAAVELRNHAKKCVGTVAQSPIVCDLNAIAANTAAMAAQMRTLWQLVMTFADAYTAEKRAQNILDFSDLEHLALEALNDDAVADDVKAVYPYLFVDEFQDISPIQDALLRRISTSGCFFCVGDVKQSIYRFRSAEPRLFIDRLAQSSPETGARNRRIDLAANFRSGRPVVDFVNFLCENLMSERLGDVAYEGAHRLVAAAAQPDVALGTANRLVLIDNAGQGEEELTRLEELQQLEREATVVANEIHRILGTPVWNGKAGAFRKVALGDIAILLRATKSAAPVYAEVLRRGGIAVTTEAESDFRSELEVQLVENLLRLIDNGMRDTELISSLYSALGNFSMEDLIEIRGVYSDDSFASAVDRYRKQVPGDLADRLNTFLDQVALWREYARHADIEKLLYRIYDDTGFYEYAATLPEGEARQGNLRLLATLARGYTAGLYDFLQALQDLQSGATRPKRSGRAFGAVSLMSVHKSKGLEFPVVVLANLGKKINLMDTREALLMHGELGLGPCYLNAKRRTRGDTLAHGAIAQRGVADTLSEEMRMLYVALTRARELLILVGTVGELDKKLPQWAAPLSAAMLRSRQGGWLDWIGAVAVRCAAPLRQRMAYPPEQLPAPAFDCEVVDAAAIKARRPERADRVAALRALEQRLQDVTVSVDLQRAYGWQYAFGDVAALPGKVSATSLLDKERNWRGPIPAPEIRRKPAFLEEKNKYSATDRGTFAHTALQLIPFDTPPQSVPGFVADLEQRGLLPDQAAQVIELDWITGFLHSDIAGRIRRSVQVLRELPFNLTLPASDVFPDTQTSQESILVQGIIDCCFLEDGHWVLLDYKTNRVDAKHTAQAIAQYYRPQLDIYTQALERITGIPVGERYLYLLSVGQEISVPQ